MPSSNGQPAEVIVLSSNPMDFTARDGSQIRGNKVTYTFGEVYGENDGRKGLIIFEDFLDLETDRDLDTRPGVYTYEEKMTLSKGQRVLKFSRFHYLGAIKLVPDREGSPASSSSGGNKA